jgi:plasmid stabilization system protein ParE
VRRIAREVSVRVAEEWATSIREAIALLETLPEIGSPVEDIPFPGLRERIIGPYRVIYRYDGEECLILTIPRAERDLSGYTPDDFT